MFASISNATASIIDISGVVRTGDFDGDDVAEVAVSSPETDCGKGAVYVVSGSNLTTWTRDTSGVLGTGACDYLFGASLAVGDFNDDGYDDLAIAAPGANDARPTGSGSVHILYGSSTGLTATGDQLWTLDSSGIDGTAGDGDYWGDALTTGDFNCDGYADLAVGSPCRLTGWVSVLFGSSSGITATNDRALSGSGGSFGAALAAGNFDGDQVTSIDCDDLVVAAPHETVSSAANAGSMYRWAGGSGGLASIVSQTIHQNSPNVVDTPQTEDLFGWRLTAARADTDAYDDLVVTVPGDACTASVGMGQHLFHGSSTGIATTNNAVSCNTYGCSVFEDRILACRSGGPPVYGTTTSEVIGLGMNNEIGRGGAGDDELHGSHGDDVLFGGAGADIIEGGPGRDTIIAGSGDDTIVIDLDCMVSYGEVVDGGPGTDTIRSHRSQSQLASLGLTIVSVEQFVTIAEDPTGAGACVLGSYDDGPLLRPKVTVSWSSLATPDAVLTTSTGNVSLELQNISADEVDVELEFLLRVRGEEFLLEQAPVTVAASDVETVTLDLHDFIPGGVNTSSVDPALLVLPIAASISTKARLSVDTEHAGYSFPPTIFGHLQTTGATTTAVLYREGALHATYHNGNLARWRVSASAYTGPLKIMGHIEAHGSLGIPGY